MQDGDDEMLHRAGGEEGLRFKSEAEATKFKEKFQAQLMDCVAQNGDTLFYGAVDEPVSMVRAAKCVEDFLTTAANEAEAVAGSFILFGSRGFIMKYEPAPKPAAFKFVSPNGLLCLPVDTIKEILDKYLNRK